MTIDHSPILDECLTTALKRFDRKERYFLVRTCLGKASEKLDKSFLDLVSAKLNLSPALSETSWWTTDYHLDWLAGALAYYYDPTLKTDTTSFENGSRNEIPLVTGSQEDADLLIVDGTRLIVLEAKRYGTWGRQQVERKCHRVNHLRNFAEGRAGEGSQPPISIHLLFSSPSPRGTNGPPTSLRTIWAKLGMPGDPPWIPLQGADERPVTDALLTRRCFPSRIKGGRPKQSATGTHWFIDTVSLP